MPKSEPQNEDRLQQYFDGELSPEVAEALRLEIEGDEDLRAKLDGLTQLRVLIRGALAPEHLSVPSDDAMFEAIEARLGESEAADEETSEEALAPILRVVEGGKGKVDADKIDDGKVDDGEVDAPPRQAPAGARVWFGVAGLALAAAAALWFFVLRPGDSGTVPNEPGDHPDVPLALAPPPGSEIEQIDLGYSTGAIFQVEDEGAQYAVVWIGDEKPVDFMPGVVERDEERIQ